MHVYITTKEGLESAAQDLTKYINQQGSNVLAVDCETYADPCFAIYRDRVKKYFKNGNVLWRPIRNPDGSVQAHIRTLQIGTDCTDSTKLFYDKQYIFDVKALGYELCKKYLKPILESAVVLGHNLKYDYQFLYVLMDIDISKRKILDTMIISKVLLAGDKSVRHGLAKLYDEFIAKKNYAVFFNEVGCTPEQYFQFKDLYQTSDWEDEVLSEEQIKYSSDDVRLIFFLYEFMIEELSEWKEVYEKGRTEFGIMEVIKMELSLVPVIARMELRGIPFDSEYHANEVVNLLARKAEEALSNINLFRTVTKKCSNGKRGFQREVWEEEVIEPINVNSNKQLGPALEEEIRKLDPSFSIKTTAKGNPSVDEDYLKELYRTYKLDKISWVLAYKKATSFMSKFGLKLIDLTHDDGMLRPECLQIGSDENAIATGRSSFARPNIQQQGGRGVIFAMGEDKGIKVKKLLRSSFKAKPGWVIIDADFKQIEARIAAELCGEEWLVQRFINDKDVDIYAIIAKAMMGLDYEPGKNTYERDYIGKTAGLQLIYGAWWKSLMEFMRDKTDGLVNWTEYEAKTNYHNFFKQFSNVKAAMQKARLIVEDIPKKAGESLAMFKNRKPFAVASSVMGRTRRFCLKPYLYGVSDSMLSKEWVELDRNGTRKANIYSQEISSAARESFNFRIQGTAADVLKKSVQLIDRRFIEAGFEPAEGIIALVHDEVMVYVKQEHEEQATKIMYDSMVEAGKMIMKRVPLDVDIASGESWYAAKP